MQWRRKQFASGDLMLAKRPPKIFDVPPTFLLCPHMGGTTIVCYQLRDN